MKQDINAGQPGLAWLLISGLGSGLAAVIVAGTIVGRLGAPLHGALLPGAALLGVLPRLLLLLRGRWQARWPELVATLLALAAGTGIGLSLAWPDLLPPGRSVDAVLHYVLVHWIAVHDALPQASGENLALLGEMAVYPPGLALVVVAAAHLSGQPPLTAMYPMVALLGGLIVAQVVILATAASQAAPRWRTTPLALLSTLLLLAHRTYTLGAYADQNFYPMTLGMLLVLLAGGWLIAEPRFTPGSALLLGLTIAALMGTYPLWTPIPVALAALALLVRPAPWRHRAVCFALTLAPALPLGLIAVLPYLGIGRALLAHEGFVARPAPGDLIPLLLALPGTPLVIGSRRGRWLLALAGLALGQLLALRAAAWAGLAADYHSAKILFVLTPLGAAIAGAAAIELATLPRLTTRLAGLGTATLLLVATGSYKIIPPPPEHPVTAEMVAAARWLLAADPAAARKAIAVGGPAGPQPYWLQVGLLGQNRDAQRAAVIATTPPTPEGWVVDARLPDVVVALGIDRPPPGATLLARFGQVAILRRSGPLDAPVHDPLLVRYRSFWEEERLKTAIELLQPFAGRLPVLEVRLDHDGTLINHFRLEPNPQRTRMQYLGADLVPATLGGFGYINADAYPNFAPPSSAPVGAFTLKLCLLLAGNVVDERLLATFDRTADGRLVNLAPHSGELIYLRQTGSEEGLQSGMWPFEAGPVLTGWSAPTRAAPGAAIGIHLRWQTLQPIDRPLLTTVQLADASGHPLATSAEAPQGGFYPTWRWRPGQPILEQRVLRLPTDLAPGTYRLLVGVRDPAAREYLAPIGELVVER